MNCREFQDNIPNFIEGNIPIEQIQGAVEHVEHCKDCYDELEIYYVLQYGFSDADTAESMDFVGQLEEHIQEMKERVRLYHVTHSFFILIRMLSMTCVAGALIYFVFKFWI